MERGRSTVVMNVEGSFRENLTCKGTEKLSMEVETEQFDTPFMFLAIYEIWYRCSLGLNTSLFVLVCTFDPAFIFQS